NRPARMDECFPRGMPVYPIVHLLMKRHKQISVIAGRNKRSCLHSEVSSRDPKNSHAIPDQRIDSFQVPEGDLALTIEHLINIIGPRNYTNAPLFNVTNSLGMLERHAWHQSDIAETCPPKIGDDGSVRFCIQALRFMVNEIKV